jgi:survival-of-motor-neuron-related-splicing factor 30
LGLLKISKLGYTGSSSNKNMKEQIQKHREYLKKKKAKKVERFKQLEKEKEDEKHKWKSFSSKAFGKKGFVKKSIFKTPENANGRVGVGTCGVAGQEMTKYQVGSSYRRGT